MTDEHEKHLAILTQYQAAFDHIAKEATEHFDYDAAINATELAIKLMSAINAQRAWFTTQDEGATDIVADRILDKVLS